MPALKCLINEFLVMEISVTHVQHVIYRAMSPCLIEFPAHEGIFPFYQIGMQNLDLGIVALLFSL